MLLSSLIVIWCEYRGSSLFSLCFVSFRFDCCCCYPLSRCSRSTSSSKSTCASRNLNEPRSWLVVWVVKETDGTRQPLTSRSATQTSRVTYWSPRGWSHTSAPSRHRFDKTRRHFGYKWCATKEYLVPTNSLLFQLLVIRSRFGAGTLQDFRRTHSRSIMELWLAIQDAGPSWSIHKVSEAKHASLLLYIRVR